jgi:hypothetical protein
MSKARVYDWEDPNDFDYTEKPVEPVLVVVNPQTEDCELSEESRRGLAQLVRPTISISTVLEPEQRTIHQRTSRLAKITASESLPPSKDAGFLELIGRSIKSFRR